MSEESVKRLIESNIVKYGSYDNWKAEMKKRAIMGGKKSKRKLTKKQAQEMAYKSIQAKRQPMSEERKQEIREQSEQDEEP